jgi:hypothetical protein
VGRKVGAPATEFFLIWVSVEIRQISYLGPGEGSAYWAKPKREY